MVNETAARLGTLARSQGETPWVVLMARAGTGVKATAEAAVRGGRPSSMPAGPSRMLPAAGAGPDGWGSQNVGKSALINRLVRQEVVDAPARAGD